jgi:argininosuccinate lyase
VSKDVIRAKKRLGEAYDAFTSAFKTLVGRATMISAEQFAEIASPEHFVAVRDRFGGPAPTALDASFARYRAAMDGLSRRAAERLERQSVSERMLGEAFERLAAR